MFSCLSVFADIHILCLFVSLRFNLSLSMHFSSSIGLMAREEYLISPRFNDSFLFGSIVGVFDLVELSVDGPFDLITTAETSIFLSLGFVDEIAPLNNSERL